MQFDSVAAALEMAGHGPYVWTVTLITLAVVTGLLLLPVLRSRRFIQQQRGVLRREAASASGS
jgi:heme exporter protein D